jgi:hypothetical protein
MNGEDFSMQRRRIGWLLMIAGSLTAPFTGAQQKPMPPPPASDTTHARPQPEPGNDAAINPLRITFDDKSADWTPAKLAQLPHTTITVHNGHTNADETYSGVLLIQLLTQVGVPERPRGKDLRIYLVAEGRDGYKVVYSLAEVAPDLHEGTVLLADRKDGKPMGENGPMQIICTGEKHPARWVRNVVAIHVLTAD